MTPPSPRGRLTYCHGSRQNWAGNYPGFPDDFPFVIDFDDSIALTQRHEGAHRRKRIMRTADDRVQTVLPSSSTT